MGQHSYDPFPKKLMPSHNSVARIELSDNSKASSDSNELGLPQLSGEQVADYSSASFTIMPTDLQAFPPLPPVEQSTYVVTHLGSGSNPSIFHSFDTSTGETEPGISNFLNDFEIIDDLSLEPGFMHNCREFADFLPEKELQINGQLLHQIGQASYAAYPVLQFPDPPGPSQLKKKCHSQVVGKADLEKSSKREAST